MEHLKVRFRHHKVLELSGMRSNAGIQNAPRQEQGAALTTRRPKSLAW